MFPLIQRKWENNTDDAYPMFTCVCSFEWWNIKVQYLFFTPILLCFVVWQRWGVFSIPFLVARLLCGQECKYPWGCSARGLSVWTMLLVWGAIHTSTHGKTNYTKYFMLIYSTLLIHTLLGVSSKSTILSHSLKAPKTTPLCFRLARQHAFEQIWGWAALNRNSCI